jgi:5-methylcytosine-specific restriction protein A
MKLNESLRKIASEYKGAREGEFSKNPLADFVRNSKKDLQKAVGSRFMTASSPGQGNWAKVPWLGVFDPAVTTSAQSGFYVVFVYAKEPDPVPIPEPRDYRDVRGVWQ